MLRWLVRGLEAAALATLVAVVVFNINAVRNQDAIRNSMLRLRELGAAVESYRTAHGHFPAAGDGSIDALRRAFDEAGTPLPETTDGWGRPIGYRSDGRSYLLWSTGSDGATDATHPPGEVTSTASDLVYTDGQFYSFPTGLCGSGVVTLPDPFPRLATPSPTPVR